jgi:hypothetical protein
VGTDGHTGGRAERQRMVAGRTCRSRGPELTRQRAAVKRALHEDNSAHPGAEDRRAELLRTLLGSVGEHVWLEPSFRCDCGSQITMGSGACADHDRAILGRARHHRRPRPLRPGRDPRCPRGDRGGQRRDARRATGRGRRGQPVPRAAADHRRGPRGVPGDLRRDGSLSPAPVHGLGTVRGRPGRVVQGRSRGSWRHPGRTPRRRLRPAP